MQIPAMDPSNFNDLHGPDEIVARMKFSIRTSVEMFDNFAAGSS